MISELLAGGGVAALVGVLAKLAVEWWRGRRKDSAEGDIAEGSVTPTLVEKTIGAADAQIVFLEKANAAERASYERRIKALESDVKRLTTERDGLRSEVEVLRSTVSEMRDQLGQVQRRLDALPPHS